MAVAPTMNSPWKIATANRPSASPRRIVGIGVDVDSIRRDTPSVRDRISCDAPVSEVRKMKSISWPWAPSAKPASSGGKSDSPTVVTSTSTSGSVAATASAVGSTSAMVVPVSFAANVAARASEACSDTAAATMLRRAIERSFGAARYSTSTDSPAVSRSV